MTHSQRTSATISSRQRSECAVRNAAMVARTAAINSTSSASNAASSTRKIRTEGKGSMQVRHVKSTETRLYNAGDRHFTWSLQIFCAADCIDSQLNALWTLQSGSYAAHTHAHTHTHTRAHKNTQRRAFSENAPDEPRTKMEEKEKWIYVACISRCAAMMLPFIRAMTTARFPRVCLL